MTAHEPYMLVFTALTWFTTNRFQGHFCALPGFRVPFTDTRRAPTPENLEATVA